MINQFMCFYPPSFFLARATAISLGRYSCVRVTGKGGDGLPVTLNARDCGRCYKVSLVTGDVARHLYGSGCRHGTRSIISSDALQILSRPQQSAPAVRGGAMHTRRKAARLCQHCSWVATSRWRANAAQHDMRFLRLPCDPFCAEKIC